MKILIFGLPGSGKTTLALYLIDLLGEDTVWYNADEVRKANDDWDFSDEGRLRQAERMRDLMNEADEEGLDVICDFVCPTHEYRNLFDDDVFRIWVDAIDEGRFDDTNKLFQIPQTYDGLPLYDYRVPEQRGDKDASEIYWILKDPEFDYEAPTTQMLGRFQPWHPGHRALFERALEKTGQVFLMVRDMPESEDNPFDADEAVANIKYNLTPFAGQVKFVVVPNITHITYGRGVGYRIEQEHFDEEIENISATKIRENMKNDSE